MMKRRFIESDVMTGNGAVCRSVGVAGVRRRGRGRRRVSVIFLFFFVEIDDGIGPTNARHIRRGGLIGGSVVLLLMLVLVVVVSFVVASRWRFVG